jgi:hypothetical protein
MQVDTEKMVPTQMKSKLKKKGYWIVSCESAGGGNRAHSYWFVYWNDLDDSVHVQTDGTLGGASKSYNKQKAMEIAITKRYKELYTKGQLL